LDHHHRHHSWPDNKISLDLFPAFSILLKAPPW
jgi:hypothetical protein